MPYEDYDYPEYPKLPSGPTSPARTAKSSFDPWSLIGGGFGAIGSYFSARAQAKAQEKEWKFQLQLEKLRIEAQKELERMRRTLDPEIYQRLKSELLRPSTPHAGAYVSTGTYRQLLEG